MSQGGSHLPASAKDLADALHHSKAFRALSPLEQEKMRAQAAKVFGYLERGPESLAMARPLNDPPVGSGANGNAGEARSPDVIRRAGPAAQNMLESLAFPDFVASLVQGTFQAIVDSSI
ncbi:MAG: hypothetical protein AAFR74_08320, partial [Pseudomonadota bacterium]